MASRSSPLSGLGSAIFGVRGGRVRLSAPARLQQTLDPWAAMQAGSRASGSELAAAAALRREGHCRLTGAPPHFAPLPRLSCRI